MIRAGATYDEIVVEAIHRIRGASCFAVSSESVDFADSHAHSHGKMACNSFDE